MTGTGSAQFCYSVWKKRGMDDFVTRNFIPQPPSTPPKILRNQLFEGPGYFPRKYICSQGQFASRAIRGMVEIFQQDLCHKEYFLLA